MARLASLDLSCTPNFSIATAMCFNMLRNGCFFPAASPVERCGLSLSPGCRIAMPKLPARFFAFVIVTCLTTVPAGAAQSPSWVNEGQTRAEWAETLAAQRKEIEGIKVLFARIDERMVRIDQIHREIEGILKNPEATVACVALEELSRTKAKLTAQYESAPNDAEKVKVRKDLDLYKSMFDKAKSAASRFDCSE